MPVNVVHIQTELVDGEEITTTMETPTIYVLEEDQTTTTATTETDTTTFVPTPEPTTTSPTTTAHPHSFPLPWAYAHFYDFTEEVVKDYHVMHMMFTGRAIKPWGHSSKHAGEPFNAIFAMPNNNLVDSLVVFIHDGPHQQFTSCFDIYEIINCGDHL